MAHDITWPACVYDMVRNNSPFALWDVHITTSPLPSVVTPGFVFLLLF